MPNNLILFYHYFSLQKFNLDSSRFSILMYTYLKALFSCRRFKKPSHQKRTQGNQTRIEYTNSSEHNPITIHGSLSFDQYYRFSMAELTAATKNFSPDLIIGDGVFSLVYKARLSNGIVVAVKSLDTNVFQGVREFRAVMETLGKLRHRNIPPLVGYCESGNNRLLVYKFMERGSLDQWLHDASSNKIPLSWETRIKIVRGVANDLSYLHGLERPIIHRNISASNILLDYEFEAQIANFGLARRLQFDRSHTSTDVAGTMCYLPPEYVYGFSGETVMTVMGDVYSFGVLMLEIITGQRPDLLFLMNGKDVGMVNWAIKMVAQNSQKQMIDPNILRKGLIKASVKEYFNIACMCTLDSPTERPVMTEIVHLLNQILP